MGPMTVRGMYAVSMINEVCYSKRQTQTNATCRVTLSFVLLVVFIRFLSELGDLPKLVADTTLLRDTIYDLPTSILVTEYQKGRSL